MRVPGFVPGLVPGAALGALGMWALGPAQREGPSSSPGRADAGSPDAAPAGMLVGRGEVDSTSAQGWSGTQDPPAAASGPQDAVAPTADAGATPPGTDPVPLENDQERAAQMALWGRFKTDLEALQGLWDEHERSFAP